MAHTFILSTEGINSYGFRVLTAGIGMAAFLGNPVMLWMHDRARLPIGRWENLRVADGQLLGDAVFDEGDPFAKTIADKVKNGFIKACSIGFHVLTVSVDKKDLMDGQKGATVTSCELMEISVVDIPSNKGCVSLYDASGELITLKAGEPNAVIPLVHIEQPKRQQLNILHTMDITTLASQLHLPTTATLADVTAEIVRLQSAVQGYEAVEATRKVAERDTLLHEAIKSGKLSAADITHWHELFAANENAAKKALAGTAAPVKLSGVPNMSGAAAQVATTHNGKTFKELSKENPKELEKLRMENPALFQQLYQASYGGTFGK